MKFPIDILESLISNTRLDHKGENLYGICPYCNEDEFGISLSDYHRFRCFRGNSCGETGNIFTLLRHLDKMELLGDSSYYQETDIFGRLEKRELLPEDTELTTELQDMNPPLGWRECIKDSYLSSRGFTPVQFEKYEIGKTRLLRNLKGFVVFLIRQNGKIKGYVSRNTKSKEEIDRANSESKEYNKGRSREEKKGMVPRYLNSTDTDFSKIVYGLEDAKREGCRFILLVEGLFDKINLEIIASTLLSELSIGVCCTWGKKVSQYQRKSIEKSGIRGVILLYDPDAIEDSKRYGFELASIADTVKIGFLRDKDPGDLSYSEFSDVMSKLQDPMEFRLNTIQRKIFN